MGVIIIIVLAALALSLYDFFSSRDTQRLSQKVASEKNQKYGAYAIARSYNIILTVILLCFLLLCGAYLGLERGFAFSWNAEKPEKIEHMDTFKLMIAAPPVEHIETLPPSYRLNPKTGNGSPSAGSQQAEKQEAEQDKPETDKPESQPERRPEGDKPQKAAGERPPKQKYSSIEEQIRAEERRMFEEAGGEAKRAEIRRKMEEDRKRREEEQKKRQQQSAQTNPNQGGSNAPAGKVETMWKLDGRTPHNNDERNIKNPQYTCEQGYTGKIVLKIKVNGDGVVTDAEPMSNVAGLAPCLLQQAKEYAKRSRFNTSSKTVQEGTMTYIFSP